MPQKTASSRMYFPGAYFPEEYFPEAYFPEVHSLVVHFPEACSPETCSPEVCSPEVSYFPEAFRKFMGYQCYCLMVITNTKITPWSVRIIEASAIIRTDHGVNNNARKKTQPHFSGRVGRVRDGCDSM